MDWTLVGKLHDVHRLLQQRRNHDMDYTVRTLKATLKEMNEEHQNHIHATSKWVIHIVGENLPRKGRDYIVVAGMIKALVEVYNNLSIMEMELTESRCNELKIPLQVTDYDEGRNLHRVTLDAVFGNEHGSMDAIVETYKTQKKTSGTLPSGVPTGQGQP